MLEAGITDPLDYPLALDGLVGLTMAFKVKWQPSLNNATVVSIYQDRSVINQLLHSWGQESIPSPSREADIIKQLTESVDEAVTNEDCTVVTDVDITSEHIPLPVTPTSANKRIAPPISNDNVASSEIPAGEQSSTKMKKIIKVEKLAP
ncbi:uncharacterized protein LOC131617916 isoform X3 [Vicia villosa]|uniref:uncharacterized protein LOC131617916 isoform X3 n=1 Tax=Vicia villosa TaxID=3911 RepID=UPI00273C2791|nr:uncharacterized protein LOC131617916 isoform X3 [Vicia villosa]